MDKVIFKEGRKYTFSDYFYFPHPTEEIANALGYAFTTKLLELPGAAQVDNSAINALQARFYEILPKISLDSEMAKRDFMDCPDFVGSHPLCPSENQCRISYRCG